MARRDKDSVVQLLERIPCPGGVDERTQSTVALSPEGKVFVLGDDGLSVGSLPAWKKDAQMQRLTSNDFIGSMPEFGAYTHLKLNEDASLLLLYGPNNIGVMLTDRTKTRGLNGQTTGFLFHDFSNEIIDHDGEQSITQADWHPLEQSTFCVLTTPFRFVVADVQPAFFLDQFEEDDPEYVDRNLYEMAVQQYSVFANSELVAFSFGGDAFVWLRFAVFFLGEAGDIYVLCPIIPTNTILSSDIVTAMRDSAEDWRSTDSDHYARINSFLTQLLGTDRAVPETIVANATFCADNGEDSFRSPGSPARSLQMTPGAQSPYRQLGRRYRNSGFHHLPMLQGPFKAKHRVHGDACDLLMLRRVHGPALCCASKGGEVDMFVLDADVEPMWGGGSYVQQMRPLPQLILTDTVRMPVKDGAKHTVVLYPDPAMSTSVHVVIPALATAVMLHLEWLDNALEQTMQLTQDLDEQESNVLGRPTNHSINHSRTISWIEDGVVEEVKTHMFTITRFDPDATGDIIAYHPLQDAILGHKLLMRFGQGGVRWENLSIQQQRWVLEARERNVGHQHALRSEPWQLPIFKDILSRLCSDVRERANALDKPQLPKQPGTNVTDAQIGAFIKSATEEDIRRCVRVEQSLVHEVFPNVEELKFRTLAQAESLRLVKQEQEKRLQDLIGQLAQAQKRQGETKNKLTVLKEKLDSSYAIAQDLLEQAQIGTQTFTSGEMVMQEKLEGWRMQCIDMSNRLDRMSRELHTADTTVSRSRSPKYSSPSWTPQRTPTMRLQTISPDLDAHVREVLKTIQGVIRKTEQLQQGTAEVLQDVPVVRAEMLDRLLVTEADEQEYGRQ